ncbi:hypothetical protein ACA910_020067 [Epithemia clementina (nom. ined.)]
MTAWGFDVYLLQETWLLGDWEITTHGCTIICHGPAPRPCARGTGGVAIILGCRAQCAWHATGKPDPYRPGCFADYTTQYMTIKLLFNQQQCRDTYILGTVYAPDSGTEARKPGTSDIYVDHLTNHLQLLRPNKDIIIGGDFNAQVVPRLHNGYETIIDPYGLGKRNENGERVLDLARNTSLRIASTYMRKHQHWTYCDPLHNNSPRQLDYTLISQSIGHRLLDSSRYQPRGNVISDHIAVRTCIRLE